MNGLYPIPKRQRQPGAFPTADAMRAAKVAASVTLDPILPPVVEMSAAKPVKVSMPNKSHDDPADK